VVYGIVLSTRERVYNYARESRKDDMASTCVVSVDGEVSSTHCLVSSTRPCPKTPNHVLSRLSVRAMGALHYRTRIHPHNVEHGL